MENKMLPVDTIKFEVDEVKVETSEVDNGSLGVDEVTWELELHVKDESTKSPSNSMKKECNNDILSSIKYGPIDKTPLMLNSEKIKSEKELEDDTEVSTITDEVFIKHETDSDTFMAGNREMVLDSTVERQILGLQHHAVAKKAKKKTFSCYDCGYIACHKVNLINHMKQHKNPKSVYQYSSNDKLNVCTHCTATFKSKFYLDDHIVKKHPNFIKSISSKIHDCKYCPFKTTIKASLGHHMFRHPEAVDSSMLKICEHCDATFISRSSLDDHIVRKHPTCVEAVSRKIHECQYCTFKTTHKSSFDRHVFNHSQTSLYKCTHCTYEAMTQRSLTRHMHQYHAILEDTCKVKLCKYCDATFKTDFALDLHTIRKHPDFFDNISRKIHKCKHCPFKTVDKSGLARHMFKHSDTADRRKDIKCLYCTGTFCSKQSIHEHIVQKHPEFAEHVSGKIHECAYCPYKTTRKLKLDMHMLKHPEVANVCEFSICIHCSKKFKKQESLRVHILKKHTILVAPD